MSSVRRFTMALVASTGILLGGGGIAASAADGGRQYTVELTGAAEVSPAGVPNQGDPDGSGLAVITVNPGQMTVCWSIEVSDVEPITAAHIHAAPATTTGPVVVPLSPYTEGCTTVTRELAKALMKDPASYYVNVHNMAYPPGALRGQLDS